MCVFVTSILRQYLVVVFRDKPLELWDIRTGTLLREMAKNFPTVTALVQPNLHTTETQEKKNLCTAVFHYTYVDSQLITSPIYIFT